MINIKDEVEYGSQKYTVLWIGMTRSGKYMAKIRQKGSYLDQWVNAADLKEPEIKTIRMYGFTKSPCEDCLDLSYPGTICSVTGMEHV